MSDPSTSNLKFDHTAISAIIKMISPLGENELLNDEFEQWYVQLNNGEKSLADLIGRLKGNNQININSFLQDPLNYDTNKTFISNVVPSTIDKQLVDPTKKTITMPYESTLPLTNNSLTEVKGKFELKNGTYIFNVNEQKVLMNDWGDFKF
jgi:hypothetical protein